jgi:hypothetical protein
MSRPDFFEPTPASDNIHFNYTDRRSRVGSILGKRKAEEAFGRGMNDKERYGQEIPPDFFKLNHGHNAFPSSEYYTYNKNTTDFKQLYEDRIQYWREKYSFKR